MPGTPKDMLLPRLSAEDAFPILLRGLGDPDSKARTDSALYIEQIHAAKPIINAKNVGQLQQYLNVKLDFFNSPLWDILTKTTDRSLLEAIPDSTYLLSINGNYPRQASDALANKYATREVKWKYGSPSTINLPNSILLEMLQSNDRDTQIVACCQLSNNYYSIAMNDLADSASCEPVDVNSSWITPDYKGKALMHDTGIANAMGISTWQVISRLDELFAKGKEGHFPNDAACGPVLWHMLTGERRGEQP